MPDFFEFTANQVPEKSPGKHCPHQQGDASRQSDITLCTVDFCKAYLIIYLIVFLSHLELQNVLTNFISIFTRLIIYAFVSIFAEITHLFFQKENDWGYSNFLNWSVCQTFVSNQLKTIIVCFISRREKNKSFA